MKLRLDRSKVADSPKNQNENEHPAHADIIDRDPFPEFPDATYENAVRSTLGSVAAAELLDTTKSADKIPVPTTNKKPTLLHSLASKALRIRTR